MMMILPGYRQWTDLTVSCHPSCKEAAREEVLVLKVTCSLYRKMRWVTRDLLISAIIKNSYDTFLEIN